MQLVNRIFFLIFLLTFLSLNLVGQDSLRNWIALISNADSNQISTLTYNPPNNYPSTEIEVKECFKYLHSKNPSIKKAITILLGESGKFPFKVLPELLKLMQDENEQVREQAVVAVSKYDSFSVIPLIKLLDNNIVIDPKRRIGSHNQTKVLLSDLAMIGLINIKTNIVGPLFKTYIDNINDYNKRDVIKYILSNNKYITPADLIPFLNSENDLEKILSLFLLGNQKSEAEYAIPFIKALLNQKNKDVIIEALTTLCKLGPKSLPIITEVINDLKNDSETRLNIILNLSYIGESSLPLLIRIIENDPVSKERISAINEIDYIMKESEGKYSGMIYFDNVFEILIRTLLDKDLYVANEAAHSLSLYSEYKIPSNESFIIPNLIKALRSQSGNVQERAAELLGKIKELGEYKEIAINEILGGLSQPPLFNINKSEFWNTAKMQFIKSIGIIKTSSPKIIQVFTTILKTDSLKYLLHSVFEAVGNLGEFSSPLIPIIVKKLPIIDPNLREVALTALLKINTNGIYSLIGIVKLSSYNDSFKITAIKVLGNALNNKDTIISFLKTVFNDKELDQQFHITAAESLFLLGLKDLKVESILRIAIEQDIQNHEIYIILNKKKNEAIPFLIELLNDSLIEYRSWILKLLFEIDSNTLRNEILIRALNNSNDEVKSKSLEILNDFSKDNLIYLIKTHGLLDSLKKLINDGDEETPTIDHAFDLINTLKVQAKPLLPTLDSLLSHKNPLIQLMAVQVIGSIGVDTLNFTQKISFLLNDKVIKDVAAKTLIELHIGLEQLNAKYMATAIDDYIWNDFQNNYEKIADFRDPSYLMSGKGTAPLPPFPWPPPKYSSIGKFGVEVPIQLIGNDTTRLYSVYLKLVNALKQIDPNFEQGLFGVPGGFALLTKMERINEDGTPLPGKFRWVTGKIPPLSFTDYFGQLFFERPGYFREIAFVFTDKSNFGQSDKVLPNIHFGGTDFPPDLSNKLLKDVNNYIIIYSFKRINGGKLSNYDQLSAVVQLSNSGIYQSLTH